MSNKTLKLYHNHFSVYFTCSHAAWNYFKLISEAYCSSRIFSNMFNVAVIISK